MHKPNFQSLSFASALDSMASIFDHIPQAPEDAVFGLAAQCVADPSPNKVNLVIGAYRDEDLKPWVLPVVRKVQTELASDPKENHEYLSIDGSPVRRLTEALSLLSHLVLFYPSFFGQPDLTLPLCLAGLLPPCFATHFGRRLCAGEQGSRDQCPSHLRNWCSAPRC